MTCFAGAKAASKFVDWRPAQTAWYGDELVVGLDVLRSLGIEKLDCPDFGANVQEGAAPYRGSARG